MASQPQPPTPIVPEMVGASSAVFYLDKSPKLVAVPLHRPTGPAAVRAQMKQVKVSVNFENMTSDLPAPAYTVYLNVPLGDDPLKHPELVIGNLSMFGLRESSRPNDQHPGGIL